jgi:hypothetical protein
MSNVTIDETLIKKVVEKTAEGVVDFFTSDDVAIIDVKSKEPVEGVVLSYKLTPQMIEKYIIPKLAEIGVHLNLPKEKKSK